MNFHAVLELSVGAVLINNIVLSRFIGVCPCVGKTKKLVDSLIMGVSVMVVMGLTSVVTWFIHRYALVPHGIEYMQTIVFILVIVTSTLLAELALQRLQPSLIEKAGVHLPAVAANCAVLALSLINTQVNPYTGRSFTAIEAFVNATASGAGFALVLVLMTGIQQRLEFSNIPRSLRGLPITFLAAGLMSLAFLGFAGLHFTLSAGG
jgi:electron transport complex protein RnfA